MKRYKITIEETGQERQQVGKRWAKGAGETGDDYGYTPEIETTVDYTRVTYEQTVETLDLSAVIFAVNGIEAQEQIVQEKTPTLALGPLKEFFANHTFGDVKDGDVKDGAESIADERARQISDEGFDDSFDDRASNFELSKAAACYALHATRTDDYRAGIAEATPAERAKPMAQWPWDIGWFKPTDRRRDLVKAGALIAAEIDRLDRMEGGDA